MLAEDCGITKQLYVIVDGEISRGGWFVAHEDSLQILRRDLQKKAGRPQGEDATAEGGIFGRKFEALDWTLADMQSAGARWVRIKARFSLYSRRGQDCQH